MANSALERAFQDSERSLIACKASVSNPAAQLVPSTVSASYYAGKTAVQQEQLIEGYKDWTYCCVNAICKKIAQQPIYVSLGKRRPASQKCFWLQKSYRDDLLPIDNHPLLDALHAPNQLHTRWHLIFTTVASLLVTGESSWWIPDLPGGREIWPLPSSWIKPETDLRDNFVIRPWYSAKETIVPASQVCYFSLPNPANPFTAVSPVQAQAAAVDADVGIQEAQARSIYNGLLPTLAITAGDVGNNPDGSGGAAPLLNTEQRNSIMDALRKMYQGPAKNGTAIILDRMIRDIKPISIKPNEMAFMDSAEQIKERIFQAFGVPPTIVGQTQDATRATAVVSNTILIDYVVNPLIEMLSEVMTRWLGPLYARNGERLIVWVEPARERDHELTSADWKIALDHGLATRNEYRTRMLGIPAVPGSDVFAVPLNYSLEPVGAIPNDDSDGDDDDGDVRDPAKKKTLTVRTKSDRFGDAWMLAHGKLEKKLAADLRKLFKKQAAAVAVQLDTNPVDNMPVFRPGEWNDALTTILRKHLTQAAFIGVELELAASPVKLSKGITDRIKAIVKGAVDKVLSKGTAIYHGVNETTGEIIDGVVSAARKAGETAKDIAGKVKDVLTGESGKQRAADIARNETTLGLTTGQDAQRQEWAEDGFEDLTKTWHTMEDDRVRESHAEADGQTVGTTEHFTVGGEQAYGPGDVGLSAGNRCGCRCWTTTGTA